MRFVLTALVLLLSVELIAQNDFIISGKFKVDGGPNNGAKIVVEKNGKQVKQLEGESRFEISLDFQAIYVVSFQKEGFVTKRLRFDTNVPEDRIEYGFEVFPFTVEIFEQYDDINMVVFNQPVGRISYSELIDEFDYDTDYTKSIQAQIDQAMDDVEEAKEKKEDQAAETEKEIAQLSKTAESSAKSGNIEDAIQKYEAAQKLKKDPEIQKRIEELKKEAEGEKKQQQLEGILDKAEQAMAAGDLDEAKRLYEQANGVMAGDARVQKALAQIEEDKKAQAQQAQAFDSAVKAADAALKSGNPDAAIAKAEEALKIKADPTIDQEIQSVKQVVAQLEEEKKKEEQAKAQGADAAQVDAVLNKVKSQRDALAAEEAAAAEAEAAKKAQMDDKIAAAQSALTAGDIAGARTALQAAGELGSDPRIGTIEKQIAEQEKAQADALAAEEAAKKAKEEAKAKYDQLVAEGDEALASKELTKAEKAFNDAKTLSDDPKEALDGLASVEEMRAQLSSLQREEETAAAAAAAAAVAQKAEEEEAARIAADAEAKKAAAAEAVRIAAEQEAARAAEEAAKLAAEEAARKAEELAAANAGASEASAEEETARKAAEEAARKAAAEEAAKKAGEAAAKMQEQIAAKRSEAEGLFSANQLKPALKAYNELLTLVPNDPDAQAKISQIQGIQQKLAAEKAANEAAARAVADQPGRESEQLAEIIEQEEIKAEVNPTPVQNTPDPIAEDQVEREVLSPSISDPASFKKAQAVMEQDVRPGAPIGPIIISDDKVGEEARQTRTGQMTEDDKYDGMVKRTEEQVIEFQASEEMKALMAQYPDRRSEETEKVGNSVITWVYINNGDFITTYKKVVHNWGGVYFFVDGKATNQRFWEHESQ